jgi:hypothetical protein
MQRVYLAAVLAAFFTTASSAQTIVVKPAERPPSLPSQVRVSIAVNMFVATADDNGDQSLKAQEDARRKIYELANHECGLLRDVLASDCQLESINVNVQRININPNWNQGQRDGFNVGGNIGLRVTAK